VIHGLAQAFVALLADEFCTETETTGTKSGGPEIFGGGFLNFQNMPQRIRNGKSAIRS
jgi:hypothetical protein